jgi:hypothetical protein
LNLPADCGFFFFGKADPRPRHRPESGKAVLYPLIIIIILNGYIIKLLIKVRNIQVETEAGNGTPTEFV